MLSRYVHPYKFFDGLVVMRLGLGILPEDFDWPSITAREKRMLLLNIRQA